MTAVAAASACRSNEPSYSNINLNKNTQTGRAPAETASPNAGETAPVPGAQGGGTPAPDAVAPAPPATASSPPPTLRIPAFFDPQKGNIKDLPSYPDSVRINVQYGPLSGSDMAMIVSQASAPMEKVAEFYDRAARSNGWTVASESREPEKFRLDLKKGAKDAGTVQVTKEPGGRGVSIIISRTQAQ
jgi:hypothetical protein